MDAIIFYAGAEFYAHDIKNIGNGTWKAKSYFILRKGEALGFNPGRFVSTSIEQIIFIADE